MVGAPLPLEFLPAMRTLPWPEMDSVETPGRTIRWLLDYIIWISREMRQLGHHSGSDREEWCRRVQRAYAALFIPMFPGRGDPYPPDVPPARNPGIWPDVPSSAIPGMTVRHQLTVAEMVMHDLRTTQWTHARADEIAAWDSRLSRAYAALDHGEAFRMPEEATTETCQAAIDLAEESERALKEKARRRAREIKKHLSEKREAKKAAKKAKKKATPKKADVAAEAEKTDAAPAPKKPAATKKKAAPKKKASTKKKAAKKKAAKKSTKKKTAKKKASS
jgi:metal-sulfur cluster biosynthetic enzyme